MLNKIVLSLLASMVAVAGAHAGEVTPTFDILAGKCFSGSAYNRGARTAVKTCFNDAGNHAFYQAERFDRYSGKQDTVEIDTPVKIADDGKLILRSFMKIATMKVSRDRSGRLKMKGKISYEGEPWGSLSLKESVTGGFREFQMERGAK